MLTTMKLAKQIALISTTLFLLCGLQHGDPSSGQISVRSTLVRNEIFNWNQEDGYLTPAGLLRAYEIGISGADSVRVCIESKFDENIPSVSFRPKKTRVCSIVSAPSGIIRTSSQIITGPHANDSIRNEILNGQYWELTVSEM